MKYSVEKTKTVRR